MREFREKLFITLFTISFLINLNQCSNKSDDFNYDREMNKIEFSQIKSELSLIKTDLREIKAMLYQQKKAPVVEVKETKVNKPVIVEPVVVDSATEKIDTSTLNLK